MTKRCDHGTNHECLGCHNDTFDMDEYYMLRDEAWLEAFPNGVEVDADGVMLGMLCIGCWEERAGRTLTGKDFSLCPLNYQNLALGSPRLQNRLTTPPAAWTPLEDETDPQ